MLKMAMLLDFSDWNAELKPEGREQVGKLKTLDFAAPDWQERLSDYQVDLILVRSDTFQRIMQTKALPGHGNAHHPGLTQRERDILSLSAEGKMIKEMAAMLHISEKTIKTHLGNIFLKLGVRSRAEAIAWYYNQGSAAG
jgi:DNA-binding NarL/FixJ family response regulator